MIYTCSSQRSLAISLQSLSLPLLSTPLLARRVDWVGGTDTNIFHTFFLVKEVSKLRDLPPLSSWVTHTRDKLMNRETEGEGEGFLLVFPGVYLTWLHLRFFSQVSNIHQSIRCPPPTEGLNGKLPWYDLLFCSQNMFTHTFIWILNGNMP